jgi:hypothetical protein
MSYGSENGVWTPERGLARAARLALMRDTIGQIDIALHPNPPGYEIQNQRDLATKQMMPTHLFRDAGLLDRGHYAQKYP